VKNQFKENPKTKEATKENKHGVADEHENEAQRPQKIRGVANLQSTKNLGRVVQSPVKLNQD